MARRGTTIGELETARHRALADPTRARIVALLRASAAPLDAGTLARSLGLHVSTIRWHLGLLEDGGVVTRRSEERSHPGRPRVVYDLAPGALDAGAAGFALLTDVLADCLARAEPEAARLAEEAGRARGRSLVRPHAVAGAPSAEDAEAEVLRLLEGFGFQPELDRGAHAERIRMRPCPFGKVAAAFPSIVCPVHLGLMRGAFDALGAPVQAARLEPFVEPNLCVAHLERRPAQLTAAHT